MSKDSLHLPKTAFSMKASLPTREPEILKKWEKLNIFEKLRKNSKFLKKRDHYFKHYLGFLI